MDVLNLITELKLRSKIIFESTQAIQAQIVDKMNNVAKNVNLMGKEAKKEVYSKRKGEHYWLRDVKGNKCVYIKCKAKGC